MLDGALRTKLNLWVWGHHFNLLWFEKICTYIHIISRLCMSISRQTLTFSVGREKLLLHLRTEGLQSLEKRTFLEGLIDIAVYVYFGVMSRPRFLFLREVYISFFRLLVGNFMLVCLAALAHHNTALFCLLLLSRFI